MVLKRPFISDTEQASVHCFRSPRRQSISHETELYNSVEMYSKGSLEKTINQWQRVKSLCSHLGLLVDRSSVRENCLSLYNILTWKMVLKRLFIRNTGELPGRQRSLSQYDRFTWKMVLKKHFAGDTGEDCTLHIHYSDFPKDRILSVGVLELQGLILDDIHLGSIWWSWKDRFFAIYTVGGCGGPPESTYFE